MTSSTKKEDTEKKQGQKVEAVVTGQSLVIAFLDQDPVKTWYADLGQFPCSTFELKEESGQTSLIVRTPTLQDTLYTFSTRAEAVNALDLVTKALFKAKPAVSLTSPHAAPPTSGFKRFLRGIFLTFILLLCIAIFIVIFKFRPVTLNDVPVTPSLMQNNKTGIPMPADKLLGE